MKQRIISIVAVLALCLSLLPGTAWALDGLSMLTIGSVSLEAGKEYVADETGTVTEKTSGTPAGTPYLACSEDGSTVTVHGAFVTNDSISVAALSGLTVTGEAGSSLTVTPTSGPTITLGMGDLTLDGGVSFTAESSDGAPVISGNTHALKTTERYSGTIVLRSNNVSAQAVLNATLDVQNSDSIAITGTINPHGSVVLKSASDISLTCKNESAPMPAIAGSAVISAGGDVTISSSGGAPVQPVGANSGLTVIKAQSVTISGKSSDSDAFFPVPVKFENCGSVTVTDSGDGAFLGEDCTLTSEAPVSVRKDNKDKLYIDGTLWDDAGAAPEGALMLSTITTPTCWTAGEGRIFYEPSAGADSPAKLTLDSAEYDGEISANEAKGFDVTVKGSNQIGVIANQNGNLTLTGNGSLTANQVVTQQGNRITNNIADLNTVLVQFGDDKNTYEVYGEAELPRNCLPLTGGDTASYYDAVLTIQPGAKLTIPSGTTLQIRKLNCLKNEGGSIVNNGTVSLAGEAATNANADTVKALGLTGDGMVQVMTNPGGGEVVSATYTNSGEKRLTPVGMLDLRQAETTDAYWESNGYKWTDVVKDATSGAITSAKLTLAAGFNATSVKLPDTAVTIETEGESSIETLTFQNDSSKFVDLTFSGTGPLTVQEQINIASGDHNTLTVNKDANVIANGGIYIGETGGVNSLITVEGMLKAAGYHDNSFDSDVPAVSAGKLAVGNDGVLEVSGAAGVLLNGMPKLNDSAYKNLFTVTGNGRFTANCSEYNVQVGSSGSFPEGTTAEGAIPLGDEYMPDDCKAELKDGKINLVRISTGEVYSGPLTIHKNHTWETGWTWDETTHWHACKFTGCTEKQPGSEAAHFYRSCVCTICSYQAPAGTPDSDSGSSGGSSGGSDRDSSYTVTVERSVHGTVTSDRRTASRGDTVTLTVTADSGYAIDTLTVTDSRGNEIALTQKGGGVYTFTMPNRAVTVSAAFISSACTGGADCPSRAFSDLNTGKWYHEAVDYVLKNGLMDGYGSGLFGPNDTLSRAQFAQILYNRAGRPAAAGGSPFADVPSGAWYAPAVIWAASEGIVEGRGDGTFGPKEPVTREQLAVMLWRYAGSPAAPGSAPDFSDADRVSGYAQEAVRWAVEQGILQGKGGGILDPKGVATRAEVAAMFMRYLSR